MTRCAVIVRVCLVVALCVCVAEGQVGVSARVPTIDQSLEMRSVGAPQIAPDGRHVVYEETRTNWEANAFETDLWLADTATGESRPLTLAAKSSNAAAWSPDGRSIAFLSDRPGVLPKSPAGKKQVWVMPADGGEAQQLTKMENGVEGFEWAPDSRRIALAAEAPETKAMKDREETFGVYHVFHSDYGMIHLWVMDVPKANCGGDFAAGCGAEAADTWGGVQRGFVLVGSGWGADCLWSYARSGPDLGV